VKRLEDWINYGGDLTGYWYKLLSGDVYGAACVADAANDKAFGQMLRFLAIEAPEGSYGSVAAVNNWTGLLS
jgi:hypothetical protein